MTPSEKEHDQQAREDAAAQQAAGQQSEQSPQQQSEGPTADSLAAEIEAAKGAALRAQAELENFRKRSQREIEQERRYALIPFVRDLLPVVDNLQRAVATGDDSADGEGLRSGVKLVIDQLLAVLKAHQCEPIDAEGAEFDPNLHEALAQQPSAEVPRGSIVSVAQTGYRLHDRIIRPAQVFVSAGPPGDA